MFSLFGVCGNMEIPRITSRACVVHYIYIYIYINYLPLKVNSVLEPILFVDDASVIISSRFFKDLHSVSSLVLSCVIKWFTANNLVLNWDKMNIIKFISKNSAHCMLHLGYKEKYIELTVNTEFLGLQIDNHITWKNHIWQMIPKLSAACYALRSMVYISNINTLKSIYNA
jgi:hypothetical protein